MKILLFENGEPGRVVSIPGDNVLGELEELLGGPCGLRWVNRDMELVCRVEDDPDAVARYELVLPHGLQAVKTIYGSCAMFHQPLVGLARDMSGADIRLAETMVRPL